MAGNPNEAVKILDQRTYWVAVGTEPADENKDWHVRQRPPSSWFDWWFYSTYKDIEDLALFIQSYAMSREFGPGQFELPPVDGATITWIGTNDLPVAEFSTGAKERLHIASRAVQVTGEDTTMKVVWSSPNTASSKAAYFIIEYKATVAGGIRTGALNSVASVETDSVNAGGQNESWFNLGSLTPGAMLDIFVCVDATQGSHTLSEVVHVHQVILDPEEES